MKVITTHAYVTADGPVHVGTLLDIEPEFAAELIEAKYAKPAKKQKEKSTAPEKTEEGSESTETNEEDVDNNE